MIKKEDVIGYKKTNNFRGIVLEYALKFLVSRVGFELVNSLNKKADKIAIDSSLDLEAANIVKILINGNVSGLKKDLPVQGNKIKPLYLFLDEEILLFARLKNLKFKQEKMKRDKIKNFENEFEKKHPEVKRAIVNSLLWLYS